MKRRVAKPSNEDMKFFTRDLYMQFNSSEMAEADAADELWEETIGAYRRYLRAVQKELPEPARRLSKLSFHDAELMNSKNPFLMTLPEAGLIGVAKKVEEAQWRVYLIWYSLWGKVHESTAVAKWPFSKENVHWLYDEFDIARRGSRRFIHRILLSDGRILVVPFSDLGVQRMTMNAESLAGLVLQSA
jgi:hypothetical protein